EPLLVVVLEREHAFVRPVLVGEELAERIGIFNSRRLNRFEAVPLKDHADRFHHVAGGGDLDRPAIGKAAGKAGFEFRWFVGFISHWFLHIPSWPGLSPKVGYTRLSAQIYFAQLGQARVATPSTHLCAIGE